MDNDYDVDITDEIVGVKPAVKPNIRKLYNKKACAVTDCKSKSSQAVVGVVFHRFPISTERIGVWCTNMNIKVESIKKDTRICSLHFDNIWYNNTRHRLDRNVALPTLNPFGADDNTISEPVNRKRAGEEFIDHLNSYLDTPQKLNGDSSAPDSSMTTPKKAKASNEASDKNCFRCGLVFDSASKIDEHHCLDVMLNIEPESSDKNVKPKPTAKKSVV